MNYLKELNEIFALNVLEEALTSDELKHGTKIVLQLALRHNMLFKNQYATFWMDNQGNPVHKLPPIPQGLTREYMDGYPSKVKANIANVTKLQDYIKNYSLQPENIRKRILVWLSKAEEGNKILDDFGIGGGGEIAATIAVTAAPQHKKMLDILFGKSVN